ncbi:MAG: tRNA (guanine(26)-N(2))-dimethyltransferase [Candidatus Parvarchaeota archaeon]|nr:tRNA (guanine(26)-N(2))-dimethyltransferase [Candidatus Jingweiarchaeum tengchongense]MCW1298291.1 tRNA (guanine(26)-N(2))-dimethyltransferase [Candidatus Jingweiarchaeum tengchongense]MCW1300382.1 tRNA (guanine(26)-N(2))-dimethyltransferase [Candidatus Jingweiarchaeum tengchongense]MCW1304773.1 tRNA (guanine(26)-N(2))-dimethyltransferase [Candidatus Jingweiarchaeum tengchongense]MCW1305363.1 tRNA (guanine(26)-N(2))-dimethyltransferase [Candidatus Jingweiarchaeum tengchongense]
MLIREGEANIEIPMYKKLCKKMPVFYNPAKEFDRTISVVFLKAFRKIKKKKLSVLDILAASGIRGIRLAIEVDGLREVILNDINPNAFKIMSKNVVKNISKLKCPVYLYNLDANAFLFSEKKFFDYIDLDPFGSPIPFLNACVRFIRRGGILAVTATDTAALCGSKKEACLRKYDANVKKWECYPEVGIRVLAKAVIKEGAKFEIALKPVFCHATQHYYRIYFQQDIGANRVDELIKKIGFYDQMGPLWLGELFDEKFVERMYEEALSINEERLVKFFSTIKEEAKIKFPFYLKTSSFGFEKEPSIKKLITKLKEYGFTASRTHFDPKGIKVNTNLAEIKKLMTRLNNKKI